MEIFSKPPTRRPYLLAALPAERVGCVLYASTLWNNQTAPLDTPAPLLLPIPFDAPHKRAAKVGRTPLSGGDQDQKMIARAMRRGARGI